MTSYTTTGSFHRAVTRVWKPIAWVSALALTASGLTLAQQVMAPEAEGQAPPGMSSPAKSSVYNLSSSWLPAGMTATDVLFATGNGGRLDGQKDDSNNQFNGVTNPLDSRAFVAYWQGSPTSRDTITNQLPTLAAGYAGMGGIGSGDEPANANYQGRMSAVDSGDYEGSPEYNGSGPTLYVWNYDSWDNFQEDSNHPAEFTSAMMQGSNGADCWPSAWTNRGGKGSWIPVIAYPYNSIQGTVFWVPNPRAADFMTNYKAVYPNYPGNYSVNLDQMKDWSCSQKGFDEDTGEATGVAKDGWGGGEVIQYNGMIFFTGRQGSMLKTTYRVMIYDPATGIFAASGMLYPETDEDDIFSEKAKVAGDLMIDGDGNGYVIVEGTAPSTSRWHDPNDSNAAGSERAYLMKITPAANPNYDRTQPVSADNFPYLHNGSADGKIVWTYSIVTRLWADPNDTGNKDKTTDFFGAYNGSSSKISANKLKGSNWYNGLLYTANVNWLFAIDPVTGAVTNVGGDKINSYSNVSKDPSIRDMASGQEALTIDGRVFYDKNANGKDDGEAAGEFGLPGITLALYYRADSSQSWTQLSYPNSSTTSALQTGGDGKYTIFMSKWGEYLVRVVDPRFNPNADPNSANFQTALYTNPTIAVQTAASYAKGVYTSPLAGTTTNVVTAYCPAATPAEPTAANYSQYPDIANPTGEDESFPCAGANPRANEKPLGAQGSTLNPADAAIYSTLHLESGHMVPDANFGLVPVTQYDVAAVSTGNTGTFTIDGQNVTTTAQDTRSAVRTVTDAAPGDKHSVAAPPTGWTLTKIEVYEGSTLVSTPCSGNCDQTEGKFDWHLNPTGAYTIVAYYNMGCSVDFSEMVVDPAGPIEQGLEYTVTVNVKDNLGQPCQTPTDVQFSATDQDPATTTQPVFTPTTCNTGTTGTCSVTAKSDQVLTANLHGKIQNPDGDWTDVGGKNKDTGQVDAAKASPQEREWIACGTASTSEFEVTPAGPLDIKGTYNLTLTIKNAAGATCPAGTEGQFSIDEVSGKTTPTLSTTSCTADANGQCKATATSDLAGTWTLHGKIKDAATGNWVDVTASGKSSPQDRVWQDTEKPKIEIVNPPDRSTVDPTQDLPVNGTVSDNGDMVGQPVTVKDEDGNVLCTAEVQSDNTWSCNIPADKIPDDFGTDEEWPITAEVTDKAGNPAEPDTNTMVQVCSDDSLTDGDGDSRLVFSIDPTDNARTGTAKGTATLYDKPINGPEKQCTPSGNPGDPVPDYKIISAKTAEGTAEIGSTPFVISADGKSATTDITSGAIPVESKDMLYTEVVAQYQPDGQQGPKGTDNVNFTSSPLPPDVTITNPPNEGGNPDSVDPTKPLDVEGTAVKGDGSPLPEGTEVPVTDKDTGELLCTGVTDAAGNWSCQILADKVADVLGDDHKGTIEASATDKDNGKTGTDDKDIIDECWNGGELELAWTIDPESNERDGKAVGTAKLTSPGAVNNEGTHECTITDEMLEAFSINRTLPATPKINASAFYQGSAKTDLTSGDPTTDVTYSEVWVRYTYGSGPNDYIEAKDNVAFTASDVTAPDVTIVSPADGDTVDPTQDLPVNGTVTDDKSDMVGKPVTVKDEDGNVLCTPNPTVQADGTWSCTIPADKIPDSFGPDNAWPITAEATDDAGNKGEDTNTVYAVCTPESIVKNGTLEFEITPENNARTGSATGTATVTDHPVNADAKECTPTPDTINNYKIISSSPTGIKWTDPFTIAGGKATTTLTSGNTTQDMRYTEVVAQYQVDGEGPTDSDNVNFTTPDKAVIDEVNDKPASHDEDNPTYINNDKPPIEGTGTPNNKVDVTDKDGNPVAGCQNITVGSDGKWSCTPTTALPEGPNELTATQTDPATGQESEPDTAYVVVDTTKPTITIDKPADGTAVDPTQDLPVSGTVQDDNPVEGQEVTVTDEDGNVLCTPNPTVHDGKWSCTIPASKIPEDFGTDEEWPITAGVNDKAGNPADPATTTVVPVCSPKSPTVGFDPSDGWIIDPETTSRDGQTTGTAHVVDVLPDGTTVECTTDNTAFDPSKLTVTSTPTGIHSTPFIQKTGAYYTTTLTSGDTTRDMRYDPVTVHYGDASADDNANFIQTEAPTIDEVGGKPASHDPANPTYTNDDTPTIEGTGTPGNTVDVEDKNGNPVAGCQDVEVDEDGNWSCTPTSPLPAGPNELTATQTDPETGLESPASDPAYVNVDKTPPTITIDKPTDKQAIDPDEPLPVSGKVTDDNPVSGQPVTVYDPETGKTLCTATVQADGTWSCNIQPDDIPADFGSDGEWPIQAKTEDKAGNPAESDPVNVTKICTPDSPTVKFADGDGWIIDPENNPRDGQTTGTAHVVDEVNGTTVECKAGETPFDPSKLTVTSTPTGIHSTPFVQKTGAYYTTTLTSGDPSKDMKYDPVTVHYGDASANDNANFVETPGPSIDKVDDKPTSHDPDNPTYTKDDTPKIEGTGTPDNEVTVRDEDGNPIKGCEDVKVGSDGKWSCTPEEPLSEGPHDFTAEQKDPETGLTSEPSDPVYVNVDKTKPTITIDQPTDGATVDPTKDLPVSGTVDDGDNPVEGQEVTVTDENGTVLCTPKPKVDQDGNWSCTIPADKIPDNFGDDDKWPITASVDDKAGNPADPATVTVIDECSALNSDLEITFSIDPAKTSRTGTAVGTAELFTKSDNNSVRHACPIGPEDLSKFSINRTSPATPAINWTPFVQGSAKTNLTSGDPTTDVTYTDVWVRYTSAGQYVEAKDSVAFVATERPEITTVDGREPSKDPNNPTQTSDDTPTIQGTGTPGNTVTVKDKDGNPIPGCTDVQVQDDGTWSCTPTTPLPEGPNELTATQTDPETGESEPSDPAYINVDKTPPVVTINDPADGQVIDPTQDLPVSGTVTDKDPATGQQKPAAPGTTVTVTDPAHPETPLCIATVTGDNGEWSCTIPADKVPDTVDDPEAKWPIKAEALDKAGNKGSDTNTPVLKPLNDFDPKHSWVSAKPTDEHLPVYVEETYDLTFTSHDQNDAAYPGVTITYASTSDVTFTPASCTTAMTGGDASCTVKVTTSSPNHKAGTYAITATADGQPADALIGHKQEGAQPTSPLWPVTEVVNGYTYEAPAAPQLRFWGGPDACAEKSELSAQPLSQTVGADISLFVKAHDCYDNAIVDLQNSNFSLVGDATTPATNPDIAPRNGTFAANVGEDGVYRWYTTSEKAGTFTWTGTVTRNQAVTLTQHPVTEFVAGLCDVGNSHIDIIKGVALADDKDTTQVRVYAVDKFGNVVPNAAVVANNVGATNPQKPNPNTATTDAGGLADLFWHSPSQGEYSVEITACGVRSIPGWTPTLRYTPVIDFTKSNLVVTPASPIEAGEHYTATATALDSDGKPVPDAVIQFGVTQDSDGYSPTLSAQTCTTGSDGKCSVEVMGTKAGPTYEISAKAPDPAQNGALRDISGSPAEVSWVPGPPCAKGDDCKTNVVVTKNDQLANGQDTDEATLTVYDLYGNLVTAGVAWTSTTEAADLRIVTPSGTTDSNGQAVIKYTSTVNGGYPAKVMILNGQEVNGSPITLNFGLAGKATLTVTPASPQQVGTNNTYTLTAKLETGGQPAAGMSVSFTAVPKTAGISADKVWFIDNQSSCTTGTDGTCTVKIQSTTVGVYTVAFAGTPAAEIIGSPQDVEYTAGPLCTDTDPQGVTSSVEIIRNSAQADGVDKDTIKVIGRDCFMNPVPGATVSATAPSPVQTSTINPTGTDGSTQVDYTSTQDGVFSTPVTVTKDGVTVTPKGSPVPLAFAKEPYGEARWTKTPEGPLVAGLPKDANTYTLKAFVKTTSGLPWTGTVTFKLPSGVVPGYPTGPAWVNDTYACTTTTVEDGWGVCTVQITSRVKGSWPITAEIQGTQFGETQNVSWTSDIPCMDPMRPEADVPDSNRTRLEITRNNADMGTGASADYNEITIYAFDCNGNPASGYVPGVSSDDQVSLRDGRTPPATDENGKSVIKPQVPEGSSLTHDIQVTFNNINGEPTDVHFRPQANPETIVPEKSSPATLTWNASDVPAPTIEKPADGDKTNDNTPEISGTGEPGNKVTVTEDGKPIPGCVDVLVDEHGNWSCTPTTPFPDGPHTIEATQTDPNGTTSPASDPVHFDVDTKAPEPDITKVDNKPAEPDKPVYTNDDTPKIEGTGDTAGDPIEVTDKDGKPLCETTVKADKTWECSPTTALPEGPNTVKVEETDPAGNKGTDEQPVVIDKTPPKVTIDSPTDGQPFNPKEDLPVTGTATDKDPATGQDKPLADAPVTITDPDGKVLCETKTKADGTWSCTIPADKIPDESKEFPIVAVVTDPAGNEGKDEAKPVADATPPVVKITDPKDGTEFNNTKPWNVSGTVTEPDGTTPVENADVVVTNKGPNGTPGEELCKATTDGQGKWTCQVPANKPGPDGEYTIQAVATDPVGNVSEPDEVDVVVDNTKPFVEITKPGPNETVKDEPIKVEGTGTTPGDTVEVTDGKGHTCTTVVLADKTWKCDLANVPEGDQTLTATETDKAGNKGTDDQPIVVDRTEPKVTIDSPADGTPVDPDKDLPVTGSVEDGGKPLPNAPVQVKDKDGNVLCETKTDATGKFTCTIPADKVPDTPGADFPLTVVATDPAGNQGKEDTTPVIASAPKPDITYPVDGKKTNDGQPTVKGTIPGTEPIDPGTVVIVQAPTGSGSTPTADNQCTATVQADRTWECKLPKDLGNDGPKTISAVTKSPSGKTSAPDTVTPILDRTPPPINPDTSDPTHIGVDTEPNADVEIKDKDGTVICTAKADANGHAVCVPDANHVPKPGDEITIKATDEAGNVSEKKTRIIQVVVSDKEVVLPGETQQTATGYYFQPGERVHGVMNSDPMDLQWQTADATGKVVFTWTIPSADDTYVGDHVVTLTGDWSGPGKDDFKVTRGCVGKACNIPTTGADVSAKLAAGAGLATLLGVGFILLAWRRRRRDEEVAVS
jgi:hypothetical protein